MIRLTLPSESTASQSGVSAGHTLVQKLDIQAGWRLWVLNAPPEYPLLLHDLPDGCRFVAPEDSVPVEFIHYFALQRAEVEQTLQTLKQRIVPHGMIWVSWPKKSSGFRTDLDENILRDLALANHMLDVKVAAIDRVWSGLKLVNRLHEC